MGFKALATTSGGFAFSQGVPDTVPERDAVLENARAIVAATDLPVSADLLHGFGVSGDAVAETIRAAGNAGLVGASIEDEIPGHAEPFLPREQAADRIVAAVETARAFPYRFTVTARADNFFHGRADLKDTIKRLQAYEEAGADVLFAPAITDPEDIATVIGAVGRPLNVLAGIGGNALSVGDYTSLGVRRLSLGSTLWSVAHHAAQSAAEELLKGGSFQSFAKQLAYPDAMALFAR